MDFANLRMLTNTFPRRCAHASGPEHTGSARQFPLEEKEDAMLKMGGQAACRQTRPEETRVHERERMTLQGLVQKPHNCRHRGERIEAKESPTKGYTHTTREGRSSKRGAPSIHQSQEAEPTQGKPPDCPPPFRDCVHECAGHGYVVEVKSKTRFWGSSAVAHCRGLWRGRRATATTPQFRLGRFRGVAAPLPHGGASSQ
jgi:hypothetical protein